MSVPESLCTLVDQSSDSYMVAYQSVYSSCPYGRIWYIPFTTIGPNLILCFNALNSYSILNCERNTPSEILYIPGSFPSHRRHKKYNAFLDLACCGRAKAIPLDLMLLRTPIRSCSMTGSTQSWWNSRASFLLFPMRADLDLKEGDVVRNIFCLSVFQDGWGRDKIKQRSIKNRQLSFNTVPDAFIRICLYFVFFIVRDTLWKTYAVRPVLFVQGVTQ